MNEFRIELDAYTGPLDLLLYLVKKEEVELRDIPIARITSQYLSYLEWLQEFDPEAAGAFLVMAAALIEIKSRMLLPTPAEGLDDEEWEDPRLEIVRQLLEYKEMKEAAAELAARAEERAGKVARPGEQWETQPDETTGKALEDISLWTLFEAFSDILRQTGESSLMRIVADDTPIEVVITRLLEACRASGADKAPVPLQNLFAGAPLTRGAIVNMILAMLELIRQGRLRVQQREAFGAILVSLTEAGARATDSPPSISPPIAQEAGNANGAPPTPAT